MEQNIDTLSSLSEEIQLRRTKNSSVLDWTQFPLLSWLLPFLAPLIDVFILLSFLPCIMKTLQNFLLDRVSAATNQRFNQLPSKDINLSRATERTHTLTPMKTPNLKDPHLRTCATSRQLESARGSNCAPVLNPFPLPLSL
jgi:hypothetical protein